jgi:DNA-binding CsgD family transcriptional regulator
MLAPDIAQRLVTWFREQPDTMESAPRPEVTELTPREREVTQMLARGMSTEEVARELTIGVATVRTHLYRVRTKLGVRDRAQLVSLAYRSGLIQPAARASGYEKPGPREDLRAG